MRAARCEAELQAWWPRSRLKPSTRPITSLKSASARPVTSQRHATVAMETSDTSRAGFEGGVEHRRRAGRGGLQGKAGFEDNIFYGVLWMRRRCRSLAC